MTDNKGYVSQDVQDILDRKPNIQQQTSPLVGRRVLNRDTLPVAFTRQKTVICHVGQDYPNISMDGFFAATLIYRNPTNYWWYIPQLSFYIPPMTAIGAINFSTKPEKVDIYFSAPVDSTQPSVTNTLSFATFEFGDIPVPMTSLIIPAASGGGGGGPITSPLDGSGNVKVAIENAAAIPVNGTVTVQQASGANLHTDIDSLPAITGTVTVQQGAGSNLHADIDNFPAVQAVSPPDESVFTLISAASTNATLVKSAAGRIKTIQIINNNAAPRYLKLFNKASAPVTGTDTPILNYEIPANGAGANLGAGFVIEMNPLFNTGIGIALTGGSALLDNTAISAGDVIINMTYV